MKIRNNFFFFLGGGCRGDGWVGGGGHCRCNREVKFL